MKGSWIELDGRVATEGVLEAIWSDLTLAELAAKHGLHHTSIAP